MIVEYEKTVKPEKSTQSTGYRKYESNFETRFKNLAIGRRKKWGSEVYLQSVHLRRNLKKVPSNLSKISQ